MRFSGLAAAMVVALSAVGTVSVQAQSATPGDTVVSTSSRATASGQASGNASDAVLTTVKAAFEKRFHGIEVTQVRTTPVPSLYEVQIGMDLVYVDESVDYVLQGALIDARNRKDLTAERIQKLSEVPFDTLPLELAIKQVKGDGSRQMAVFEDPNCTYCKQLHATLKDIDNVTVYSFLLPILSPDSVTKARDVWCAKDAPAAWHDWMVNGVTPPSAQCDDDPVEDVMALGQKLMVRGTPAILFGDGSRVNGTLPADQLKQKLDAMN